VKPLLFIAKAGRILVSFPYQRPRRRFKLGSSACLEPA